MYDGTDQKLNKYIYYKLGTCIMIPVIMIYIHAHFIVVCHKLNYTSIYYIL